MNIHVSSGGRQLGPFTIDETRRRLAAGEFQLSDLAWAEGMAGWEPLANLPGFSPAGAPPPLPPVSAGGGAFPGEKKETSGLAVTSLISGILSVTFIPILAAIPAVICGHLAHSRIKKSAGREGGSGMALAGLIMGYLSFAMLPVIAILAGIALPVFGAVKERAEETKVLANARVIVAACELYADDHDGEFPPKLEALVPDYLPDAAIFITPFSPNEPMGYEYFPGKDTDPEDNVLFQTKDVNKRKRRVIAYVGGWAEIESTKGALPAR